MSINVGSQFVSECRQRRDHTVKLDFTLCLSVSRNNIPLIICPGSLIDDYATRLARHICLMAIADSMPSISYSAHLESYCRQLCSQIFDMLYAELKMCDERGRQHLLCSYCDQIASEILNWAYFEIRTSIHEGQPTQFTDVWQAFEEAVMEEGDWNESVLRFGSPFHQVSISFDCIQSLARMLQETDQQSRPHSATGVTVEEGYGKLLLQDFCYILFTVKSNEPQFL